jgi:hypothetical protein
MRAIFSSAGGSSWRVSISAIQCCRIGQCKHRKAADSKGMSRGWSTGGCSFGDSGVLVTVRPKFRINIVKDQSGLLSSRVELGSNLVVRCCTDCLSNCPAKKPKSLCLNHNRRFCCTGRHCSLSDLLPIPRCFVLAIHS